MTIRLSQKILLITGVAALCAAVLAHGLLLRTQGPSIPTWINYQGRLSQPSGDLVAEGSYPATFRLFGAATGGTELWTEAQPVGVKQGVFSTTLGKIAPFGGDLFNRPLWIEVEINGRILSPRQELAAVPYAMTAEYALTLPTGAVTSAMIENGAVTADKLAAGSVGFENLGRMLHASETARPLLQLPFGGVNADLGDAVLLDMPGPGSVLVAASTTMKSAGNSGFIGVRVSAIQGGTRINAPDRIYGSLDGGGTTTYCSIATNCILELPSGGEWHLVIQAQQESTNVAVIVHTYALSAVYLGR